VRTIERTGVRTGRWPADRLIGSLEVPGRALVALSGGVDSSVVAALLVRAIGERARAVTLGGPAVTAREVDRARHIAGSIGIAHEVLRVDPLTSADYRANPTNRCYFCRTVESATLRSWGEANEIDRYYDGLQSDDLSGHRPGIRAMEEAGFRHPLVEAGWGKLEVREFARSIGLPNADQPSDACLASRVRHGQPITEELLGRIARAEEVLLRHGFRRVRVRVDGSAARIEVDPGETARLLAEPLGTEVRAEIARFGFDPVAVDPEGYRGGAGA
jgi:pyridinium-3,5-biscarboxylic acid mononucleotide sulfurtransferase